jgi:RNA polymerase sigma-70 factor (ECF subfamily)
MLETLEDKELIKNYLRGDEKSLEILVKRYLKPIYSFSYKNVGNIDQAGDITQEVFVKIWKNLKKFDRNREFKPWIFQIAKNTSIDYLRKKKIIPFSRFENESGQNFLTDNLVGESPNLIETIADKQAMDAILADLDEKDQKIINLRHRDGFSFKQIAEFLKEPINTIKSRYRRIMINIRDKYAPKGGDNS